VIEEIPIACNAAFVKEPFTLVDATEPQFAVAVLTAVTTALLLGIAATRLPIPRINTQPPKTIFFIINSLSFIF